MSLVMPRAVPADQVGGLGVTWDPQERLWGAEETFPFHKPIGCDRGASLWGSNGWESSN